jgi:hypothetical protein
MEQVCRGTWRGVETADDGDESGAVRVLESSNDSAGGMPCVSCRMPG